MKRRTKAKPLTWQPSEISSSPDNVMVETTEAGNVVRIFRTIKEAVKAGIAGSPLASMPRAEAVGLIREFVRFRAGNACERCGVMLTKDTGEMHERLPKGKGGEVSLENCSWLCHACHQGAPDSAHGDRRWGGRK